jgi:hypothetical protein
LSGPLNLHSKHFIDDLRVFVTLGDFPLDGLGVERELPRLWWTLKSLYCPLHRGDLIVETELDLGDRSNRIKVERDPTLCELLNRDVGNLCGWPNFRNKSCVFCACPSIYLLFLLKFVLA